MTLNNLPRIEWLPHYLVKRDRRAKRIKLRSSKQHGLIVTVPPRYKLVDLPALLELHRTWIEKHAPDLSPLQELPPSFTLHANNETWRVTYMSSQTRLRIFKRPQNELVLMGNLEDQAACIDKLIQWIKKYAKVFLAKALSVISAQTELAFSKLTIRNQHTMWGSCSRQHAISLNYKLIFLPPSLMQHVLLHELCHTQHMNHSTAFWKCVASFDAAWRENRVELKQAEKYIPRWVI